MTEASDLLRSPRGNAWRRRAAALSLDAEAGRGARFVARISGNESRSFEANLDLLPLWLGWAEEERLLLAQASALIAHRSTLDRELSGVRLSLIAQCVGEPLFEEICDIEPPEGAPMTATALPSPEQLAGEGETLLRASLPVEFAEVFPGASGSSSARNIVELAQQCIALTRIVDPAPIAEDKVAP